MTIKHRNDAAIWVLARRISDELTRATRAVDIGDAAPSCDIEAFIATLEAQSRIRAGNRVMSAPCYAASEALDHFGFEGMIYRQGAILVIDANAEPYVVRYCDIDEFLAAVNEPHPHAKAARVRTVTMAGAGTSALGAAAFAWIISRALQQPAAAVVPSDGLADGDADILHAMLTRARNIQRVVGHGTGERVILGVARSLPRVRRESLLVASVASTVRAEPRVPLFRRLLARSTQAVNRGSSNRHASGCIVAQGKRYADMRSPWLALLASLRYMVKLRRAI